MNTENNNINIEEEYIEVVGDTEEVYNEKEEDVK